MNIIHYYAYVIDLLLYLGIRKYLMILRGRPTPTRFQTNVFYFKWTPIDSLLKARCLLGWYIVGLLDYTNNMQCST